MDAGNTSIVVGARLKEQERKENVISFLNKKWQDKGSGWTSVYYYFSDNNVYQLV